MKGFSSTISKLFFDSATCLRGHMVLCGILRCYTALTTEDWFFLEKDQIRLADHLDWLLICCCAPKADLRAASCKAIGEFCALYLDHSRLSPEGEASTITVLVNRIAVVMCERLKVEGNASAQAMVRTEGVHEAVAANVNLAHLNCFPIHVR